MCLSCMTSPHKIKVRLEKLIILLKVRLEKLIILLKVRLEKLA